VSADVSIDGLRRQAKPLAQDMPLPWRLRSGIDARGEIGPASAASMCPGRAVRSHSAVRQNGLARSTDPPTEASTIQLRAVNRLTVSGWPKTGYVKPETFDFLGFTHEAMEIHTLRQTSSEEADSPLPSTPRLPLTEGGSPCGKSARRALYLTNHLACG